jgi:hypothetical protein
MYETTLFSLLFLYFEIFFMPALANPAHILLESHMLAFIVIRYDIDRIYSLNEPRPDGHRSLLISLGDMMQVSFEINISHIP